MKSKVDPLAPANPGAGAGHAWHLVLGLTLWFAWFCATYGGLAVACAVAPPPAASGPLNWANASVLLLAVVTAAGFGFGAWVCSRAGRRNGPGDAAARKRFIAQAAAALYLTAAVATGVVALPALLLAPCA